jgi:hypothetical protein
MSPTLSEHQLCLAIRRPRELARLLKVEVKTPTPADTPRSPIRPIFTAVLRGYFGTNRIPDKARKEYAVRVASADRREKLAVQFATGKQMLEVFLMWDSPESPPTRATFARTVAPVCGWQVRIGHDMVYERPDGDVLRQIVTDSGIRQSVDLRLFAVASLVHFEALNPTIQLSAVEVWSVRTQKRFRWPRSVLVKLQPDLSARLAQVSEEFGKDAA